jgi:GTP-binding protein
LEIPDWHLIVPYSAETGLGVEELHKAVEEILSFEEEDDIFEEIPQE